MLTKEEQGGNIMITLPISDLLLLPGVTFFFKKDMPEWFLSGMEAALLAPTAMNRQKFYFELLPDNSIKITCGKGLYTKLDLGIVKYHFEVVSGKRI